MTPYQIDGDDIPGFQKMRAEGLIKAMRETRGKNIPTEGVLEPQFGHAPDWFVEEVEKAGNIDNVLQEHCDKLVMRGRPFAILPREEGSETVCAMGVNPEPTSPTDIVLKQDVRVDEIVYMPVVLKAAHKYVEEKAQETIQNFLKASGVDHMVDVVTHVGSPEEINKILSKESQHRKMRAASSMGVCPYSQNNESEHPEKGN